MASGTTAMTDPPCCRTESEMMPIIPLVPPPYTRGRDCVARACPRAIQKKGTYESPRVVECGVAVGKRNDKRTSCRVVENGLAACMGTAVDGHCGSGLVVG